jgi:hypothetical protein
VIGAAWIFVFTFKVIETLYAFGQAVVVKVRTVCGAEGTVEQRITAIGDESPVTLPGSRGHEETSLETTGIPFFAISVFGAVLRSDSDSAAGAGAGQGNGFPRAIQNTRQRMYTEGHVGNSIGVSTADRADEQTVNEEMHFFVWCRVGGPIADLE